MSKRITPLQKKIVDAHLLAAKNKSFTYTEGKQEAGTLPTTAESVRAALLSGKTFNALHEHIEVTGVSVTSQLMNSTFEYVSEQYVKYYQRRFKVYLNNLGIV